MRSQSLLQLRAVILRPAPDRCVIDIETALLQQLLNIAQRERIAKVPPDRTKYDPGFGLPPFEDRGSGYHLAILSHHQASHPESCNTSQVTNDGGDFQAEVLLLNELRGQASVAQRLYRETEASRELRLKLAAERKAMRQFEELPAGRPSKRDRGKIIQFLGRA